MTSIGLMTASHSRQGRDTSSCGVQLRQKCLSSLSASSVLDNCLEVNRYRSKFCWSKVGQKVCTGHVYHV